MIRKLSIAAALVLVAASAEAQTPPLNFDQAAYVTCKEAHAMQPEARKQLAIFLADHAARYRGVVVPDGEMGVQLGHLVRGGCTLAPDAYLFTVIDRALVAELKKLPKRR
ncbi:hypothetical protein [Reyranella sp.]|jgi:hypothetical protein|uniref:hypothetical protein n=1 Tax=Reyranella sp. TaxID=1929291 RepID=UPI00120547EA|nr:hypothetical protein [Reyranella sp.]TAJ86586.1 MAG: hypothetical protein EPO50_13475 [Reyranella sp.]